MKRKLYSFSQKEISHLLISVVVMSILVTTVWFGFSDNLAVSLVNLGMGFLLIAPAFVLHELGHKFVSQKYGYYAEYRMWTQGLIFAIIITILSGGRFMFIAPGAVYFGGGFARTSRDKIAKIGLAGPIVNLFLVAIFGLVGILSTGIWQMVGLLGAYVNAWLAIFNLIPFAPLDGQKIFAWDKKIWGIAIGLAVVAFITVSTV